MVVVKSESNCFFCHFHEPVEAVPHGLSGFGAVPRTTYFRCLPLSTIYGVTAFCLARKSKVPVLHKRNTSLESPPATMC